MSIKEQAEEALEEITDKLGNASELIGEAATSCVALARLFESAGPEYIDEAVEATAWAQTLASSSMIPDMLAEMDGDEKATPDDDDPISVTTTVREARLIAKVLQFMQQLDSSEFDADTLGSASLTYQVRTA